MGLVRINDNVKGIYSEKITQTLTDLVRADKNWGLSQVSAQSYQIDELLERPELIAKLCSTTQSDALLAANFVKKDPNSLVQMFLFSCADHLMLIKDENPTFEGFSHADIAKEFSKLYSRIKTKLPYQGEILSRKNQFLTLSLGINDGIKVGDELTVIKIYKIQRHPKFNFIISTEREIIGKIKIYKTEEELSFASILAEKDNGAVQVGGKLLNQKFIEYPAPLTQEEESLDALNQRKDKDVSFGNSPTAWLPEPDPSFGALYLGLGVGQYTHSMDIVGINSYEGKNLFSPVLSAGGELWINENWSLDFGFKQNVTSVSNPRTSSTPDTVTLSLSQFQYQAGYSFLMNENFWGPKFKLLFGLAQYKQTSGSTTPRVFTTQSFSGYPLTFDASMPIGEHPFSVGGFFTYYLFPHMSESPVTSGNSNTPTLSHYGAYTTYIMKKKMHIKFSLNFDNYYSDFSGTGTRPESASSTNTKLVNLEVGLKYLF